MSDEQETEHDEPHDEHSFPGWLHAGESPIQGFMKVFAWLVFFTILEVMAILQEFSFEITMAILFGIAAVKVWFIGSFFMHMIWDPPLVSRTAAVPVFFLAVLFLAIGLTSPGAVDDLRTICGF
ncbi:MAG: cytochrome C oxidase subunit IV family protein [Dehalococcoidia bacterium]|nr:cytochrome C oxidase subunit IV family protein [Dehalococcoidia bacterium]